MKRDLFRMTMVAALSGLPLAALAAGDLFVSSEGTNSVKVFDAVSGAYLRDAVSPGAGGLGAPQGLTFGPNGNLFVSSRNSRQVLQYTPSGDFLGVFASGFAFPADITWHNDLLYVSDAGANRAVKRFDLNGNFVDTFVSNVSGPDGQSWDGDGNFYLSVFNENRIAKFNGVTGASMGNFVTSGVGGLSGPLDNLFMPDGDFLTCSFFTGSVKRYGADGSYRGDFLNLGSGTQGIQYGPDGKLYAGDYQNSKIMKFDPVSGASLGVFAIGGGLLRPNNFAFQPVPEPASWIAIAGLSLLVLRRAPSKRC